MTKTLPVCHIEQDSLWREAQSLITAPSLGIASFDADSVGKLPRFMLLFPCNDAINALRINCQRRDTIFGVISYFLTAFLHERGRLHKGLLFCILLGS